MEKIEIKQGATLSLVGLDLWKSTEDQREFFALCAALRREHPEIKCVWNKE